MGRPRQFNETQVLDAALLAFWEHGFAACGMQHLQDATGVCRASLYNAFGNKRGLFEAVLAHYILRVDEGLALLRLPDADLRTVRQYLLTTLSTFRERGSGGCLAVSTALSPIGADPRIRAATATAGQRVRHALAQVIETSQARGELLHLDPTMASDHLFALLHGLAALHATAGDDATTATLNSSIAALESR